ncbi:MAG: CapA family protein [Myxococcota bacterium]
MGGYLLAGRRWVNLVALAAALLGALAAAHVARETWWHPMVVVPAPEIATRPAGEAPTLLFLGDTAPTDAATEALRARGWDYPFARTAPIVRAADLAVANFESSIAAADVPFGVWKRYRYRAEPDALAAIARAGIDALGLANNHAMDCGARGLRETLGHAARGGLATFGAGRDAAEARRGLVVRLGGVRVGLLGWLEPGFVDAVWSRAFAREGRPGVARLSERDVRADVARMRRHADVVIASVHWGENYQAVTGGQRRFARVLAAAGVDLVVGHHPHVAQPLAMIDRTVVAYIIGNYGFGTSGRRALRAGLMLGATLRDRRLVRVALVPIDVQNRRVRFQPRVLRGDAARRVLEPLARASRAQGAELRVEGDEAVLDLR